MHRRWRYPRVGRRGAFLAFLALLDALYGYSLFAYSRPVALFASSRPVSFNLLLPASWWAVIWLAGGAISASGVTAKRDRLQFTASAGLMTGWAMLWGYLWLIQDVPGAWVSVIIWLAFALVVLLVASWPEPPPPPQILPQPRLPPLDG